MNSRELEKFVVKLYKKSTKVNVKIVTKEEINTIQLCEKNNIIISVVNQNCSSNIAHFVTFFISKNGKEIVCSFFDPLGKNPSTYFENFPFKVTLVYHRPFITRESTLSSLVVLAYLYYRIRLDHEQTLIFLNRVNNISYFVENLYNCLSSYLGIKRTSIRGRVYYPGKASKIFRDYR